MDSPPTFLFAGGGTGGHLFPGIAVAHELQKRDAMTRSIFVGSTRAIEATIVAEQGLEHLTLPVQPLPMLRRNPFRFVIQNWRAFREAKHLLKTIRPNVVIGLGGFASAPLVWAASRNRVPVVLLEPNVIPGRTTRWLTRFAQRVCVSFGDTSQRLSHPHRAVVTGNPVRNEIAALHGAVSSETSRHDQREPRPGLLILGGSQGADSLNDAVLTAIRSLRNQFSGWHIIHQSGPRHVDALRNAYAELNLSARVEPFFHDMPHCYANACIVISRAGATTLAELACAGLPMILLPYPHAADNHQHANAQSFVNCGAAILVEHAIDPFMTATKLETELRQLVSDVERRHAMGQAAKQLAHPKAAENIAKVVLELARPFFSPGRSWQGH